MIVYAVPTHRPSVDVGVIMYSTVPIEEVLGLVKVCAIVPPELAEAPVILPVIVPIVQLKLLGALDVNAILVAIPLQTFSVAKFVTKGVGFTVTVIVVGEPTHEPPVDVGVTAYSIEPALALLGFVNV